MPTTSKSPIQRKDRERGSNWSGRGSTPRAFTRTRVRTEAIPGSRREGRLAAVKSAPVERPRPAKPSQAAAEVTATAEPRDVGEIAVRKPRSRFWSEFSAAQPLVAFSFLLGVVFTALFGVDLCTGWPFWRASVLMDVSFVVCSLGLILLSWDTYRDFR
jgi:hypothetical protein